MNAAFVVCVPVRGVREPATVDPEHYVDRGRYSDPVDGRTGGWDEGRVRTRDRVEARGLARGDLRDLARFGRGQRPDLAIRRAADEGNASLGGGGG